MKPQCLTIVNYLMTGGSITRDSAYHKFGIQNLTARLSELTEAGYDIVRHTEKGETATGKRLKVTAWKLRHRFRVGDLVKVVKDSGSFLSLKGKTGKVLKVSLEDATFVVDIPGLGMRRLAHDRLAPVEYLPAGTKVTLTADALVVGQYVPDGDSYLLLTANPNLTVAASAALVRRADAPQ